MPSRMVNAAAMMICEFSHTCKHTGSMVSMLIIRCVNSTQNETGVHGAVNSQLLDSTNTFNKIEVLQWKDYRNSLFLNLA